MELGASDVGGRDGIVGERGKPAVRGQQHALGPKSAIARSARAAISSGVSTRARFWFTTPTPIRHAAGRSASTSISPARGGAELEKERTDLERLQERQQRPVVAGKRRALVGRPVAAAHVETEAPAREAGDGLVDELAREIQLTGRVALLAEGAAHEAPRVLGAGEDHLGQHGLVELHQRRAGGEEEMDLLPQHAHDVAGQVLA